MAQRPRVLIIYVVRGHLGLQNKLHTLARGFRDSGYVVDLRVLNAGGSALSRAAQWLAIQTAFVTSLLFRRHKLVFVRYNYQFLPVFLLARLSTRPMMHLELNSDHFNEFALQGQRLRGQLNAFALRSALAGAGLVHVVSRELIERFRHFGAPGKFIYNPNYVVDEYYAPDASLAAGDVVNLVFLGDATQAWQGVEKFIGRVIVGNRWFVKNARLHIVGNSSDAIAALIAANGLTETVCIHGYLAGVDKEVFMSRMQIGIGVFDLRAKGMTETTSIKVGEYLYAGLAIVIGYQDLSLPDDSRFVLNLDLDSEVDNVELTNSFISRVGRAPQTRRLAHDYAADKLVVANYVRRVLDADAGTTPFGGESL